MEGAPGEAGGGGTSDEIYDGERMMEREKAPAEFAEQEEDSDRGDDRRTHEPANGATAASAANLIAHQNSSLRVTNGQSYCGTSQLQRQSK